LQVRAGQWRKRAERRKRRTQYGWHGLDTISADGGLGSSILSQIFTFNLNMAALRRLN
jgi:hypothetical protein